MYMTRMLYFLLYLCCCSVFCESFYVSSDGNSTDCRKSETPCKSIYDASKNFNSYVTLTILSDTLNAETNQIYCNCEISIRHFKNNFNVTMPVKKLVNEKSGAALFNATSEYGSYFSVSNFIFVISDDTLSPEGYLFYIQLSKLYLYTCSFKRDRDTTLSHSVYLSYSLIKSNSFVELINSSFYSLTTESSLIQTPVLILDNCSFSSISLSSGNGSVCSVIGESITVSQSTFIDCKVENGIGGAIYANVDTYYNFSGKYNYNAFINCSAEGEEGISGRGGAIYLAYNNVNNESKFQEIGFGSGRRKNSANYGCNLFLESTDAEVFFIDFFLPYLNGLSFERDEYMFCLSGSSSSSDYLSSVYSFLDLLNDSFLVGPKKLFIGGSRASDDNDCETSGAPCSSFDVCFSKLIAGKKNLYVISQTTLPNSLIFNKGSYSIMSYDEDSSFIVENASITISVNSSFSELFFSLALGDPDNSYSTLFQCKSLNTSFISDSFMHHFEGQYCCKGFISNTAGNLFISNCSFYRINSTDAEGHHKSCIDFSGHSFILYDSVFNDVVHDSGKGGALCLKIEKDNIIIVEGVNKKGQFKNCSSYEGGALYIELNSIPSVILFNKLIFGTRESANYALHGKDMFIEGNYIFDCVNLSSFPVLDITQDEATFIGVRAGSSVELDLVELVHSYEDKRLIYLSGDGDDLDGTNDCRDILKPCKFSYVIQNFHYGVKDMRIINNASSNNTMSFEYVEYRLIGTEEGRLYYPVNGSAILVYAKTSFVNITIHLTTEFFRFPYEGVFVVSNVIFTLSGVELYQDCDSFFKSSFIGIKGGEIVINDCIFHDFNFTDPDGAIIDGSVGSLVINSTSFKNSSFENGSGGALSLTLTDSSKLQLGDEGEETSFSSCRAKNGGAIYITSDCMPSFVLLTNLVFGAEGKNEASELGNNTFVLSPYFARLVSKSSFPFLINAKDDNTHAAKFTIYDKVATSLVEIVNDIGNTSSSAYISDKGSVKNNCSSIESMCNSFELALNAIKIGTGNVTVVNTLSSSEEIILKDTSYFIKGENENSEVLAKSKFHFLIYKETSFRMLKFMLADVMANSLFKLCSGSLTVIFVNVYPQGDMTNIMYPLIDLTNEGDAFLYSCSFNGIGTYEVNGSVIKAETKEGMKLNLSEIDFINCQCYKGNGGAIYTIDNPKSSVCLGGVSFVNCLGDYANGGGIYAEIKEESYFNISGNQEEINFRGCSALNEETKNGRGGGLFLMFEDNPSYVLVNGLVFGSEEKDKNKANEGYNIFVKANDLSTVVTPSSFPFLISSTLTEEEAIGEEKDESGEGLIIIPLKHVVNDPPVVGYVNYNTDNSKKYCGDVLYPCKTFDDIFNRYVGIDKNIILNSDYSINNEYVFNDSSYNLSDINKSFKINAGGESTFTMTVASTFENISFSLSSSHSKSLMTMCYKLLTLRSVSFSPLDGISSLFLPLLSISSEGSVTLILCSVDHISSNNINGTAIYASLSSSSSSSSDSPSLTLKGTSFINCGIVGGNGGAIYVNVTESTNLLIDKEGDVKTVFKGCYAKENGSKENEAFDSNSEFAGRGGAIYVRIGDNPGKICLDNIQMGGDSEGEKNEAVEGYDVFVEAKNIRKYMYFDYFPFLKGMDSNYSGLIGMEEGEMETYNMYLYMIENKKKNTWKIVIIVLLVVFVVFVVSIIVFCCIRSIKKKKSKKPDSIASYESFLPSSKSVELYRERERFSVNSGYGSTIINNNDIDLSYNRI